MTESLPMWRDDLSSASPASHHNTTLSTQQQQRTKFIVTVWTTISAFTILFVLGMESHGLVLPTCFSGTLFLEENLRGSPAIGLPASDEDDQFYEWNVKSKRVQTNPSVALILSESLLGSPSIGAERLPEDEDDDDKFSSVDESRDDSLVQTEEEGESTILKGMLHIWNGNYRTEDEQDLDESSMDGSDEEFYDTHEDDLIDSTGASPEVQVSQA